MAIKFKEVNRISLRLNRGDVCKIQIEDRDIVIYKKVVDWEDITDNCYLDFRHSKHSDGKYIAIMHGNVHAPGVMPKLVAVVGINGIGVHNGFKVQRADGATVSFQVFKKS